MTIFLAVWGALLSTFLAGIKLVEFLRDRVDIRVTVRGNLKIHPKTTEYGDRTLVEIKVANWGRRPVTMQSAGLLCPPKKGERESWFLMCADQRTATGEVRLQEGQSHGYLMDQAGLENEHSIRQGEYLGYALDTVGRSFYSRNRVRRWWWMLHHRVQQIPPG